MSLSGEEENLIRVLFIGSGSVNFGGAKGPWDHSKRLERLGGVKVVAIADPELSKAEAILQTKLLGPNSHMYKDCVAVKSYLNAIALTKPNAAFIGNKNCNSWCHISDSRPSLVIFVYYRSGVHNYSLVPRPICL